MICWPVKFIIERTFDENRRKNFSRQFVMKCDLEAFDVQLSLHFLIYLGLGLFYTSNDFTDLFLRLAFPHLIFLRRRQSNWFPPIHHIGLDCGYEGSKITFSKGGIFRTFPIYVGNEHAEEDRASINIGWFWGVINKIFDDLDLQPPTPKLRFHRWFIFVF